MKDEELEEHLRHYRPVGPPAELRGRVVGDRVVRGQQRMLEWMSLAAAGILIIVIHSLAAGESYEIDRMLGARDSEREAAIREVREAMGDDEIAQENARIVVALSDWDFHR